MSIKCIVVSLVMSIFLWSMIYFYPTVFFGTLFLMLISAGIVTIYHAVNNEEVNVIE